MSVFVKVQYSITLHIYAQTKLRIRLKVMTWSLKLIGICSEKNLTGVKLNMRDSCIALKTGVGMTIEYSVG